MQIDEAEVCKAIKEGVAMATGVAFRSLTPVTIERAIRQGVESAVEKVMPTTNQMLATIHEAIRERK